MKRWVQYNVPVFVCFESSDTVEHEEITQVIVADDGPEDVHLAVAGHEVVDVLWGWRRKRLR